jgi:hypothetical protein
MLRARCYRGEALDVGQVTDMDDGTARWFVSKGWAREYEAPAVLTTETADALVPTGKKRRNAIR